MKRITLILAIVATSILLQNCKPVQKEITPDAVFGNYISTYTSGVVSVESRILIKLTNEVEGDITPGGETLVSLFSFNPSVKGKAVWIDKKTIEFVPNSKMKGGITYNVKFKLNKVVETNGGPAEFPFSFKTIKQSFSVARGGLKTYPGDDFTTMSYSGYILTADVAEPEEVETLLSGGYNGEDIKFSWSHEPGRRKHFFTVDSLKRDESNPGELIIKWDGSKINVDEKGEEELIIPSLNDFKVLDASISRDPQLSIVISFSDPLNKTQNFDGLISLDEYENLKFSVDGNRLKVYPGSPVTGQRKLTVSEGVENALNYPLKNNQEFYLVFENIKPQVRLIGKGVIVPQDGQLSLPFEAVSLNAVDLRIIQVYADNVFQFLQENNPDNYEGLKKVGRLVYSAKVSLNPEFPGQLLKWSTYKINIADYVQLEQGAFYRVEIRFKKAYSLYNCGEEGGTGEDVSELEEQLALKAEQESWDNPGWYDSYYYPPGYNWQERDNACSSSYYNSSRFVARNIFASSLGIIAKEGKGHKLTIAVANLNSTATEQGVKLSVYDYQKQLMQTQVTGNNGIATVALKKKPFLLIAEKGNQTGYLRLDDGSSLSLSNFDVSGQVVQEGLKGFIYGERGVWRPGDKMFLTFILEDKIESLPGGHPVIFKLINPLGQVVERRVATSGINGFYHFAVETNDDAPTGNWEVSIQVGGSYFSKRIKVETVKPNRLKIDFKLPDVIDMNSQQPAMLYSSWLHGTPARSLEANIELKLVRKNTTFKGFERYSFNDPASNFYPVEQEFFTGQLNEQGEASVPIDFNEVSSAPGMLKAFFTTRVFEQGGDFSINVQSADVSPYEKYLGIKMPGSEDNWYKTGTDYQPEIVAVDMDGNPTSVKDIEVELYKIDWRWWWESGEGRLAHYVNGRYRKPVMSWKLKEVKDKIKFNLNVEYSNWESNGRYLLRVKNTKTGQAAGLTFYMSKWGSWRSDGMADGATMLTIRADKEKYKVGDKMKVTIPSSKNGRALVSIEGGDAVKDIFWVETSDKSTEFEVEITPEMAPNVYVFVSLMQPYGQTGNDAPLRLYGVVPVLVENPETILKPQVSMLGEVEPGQEYKVEVSEENGKGMTYTLSIVDEGLLGLTNFKTPNPHPAFYAREALGVLTWDMFDYVAGAYGASLEKAFAVGGDESLNNENKKKVNRFKPVVEFAGPFTLGKGKKKTHTFTMPNYVGAVRAMVVAGNNGAYGNAEKEVKVRKGLMILATLPRVLGPGESFTLPADVFAMKENVDNVKVSVEASDIFEIENSEETIRFNELGDQMVYFNLKVKEKVGAGKIIVKAQCGREKASQEIEIEIRNPNLPVTVEENSVMETGKEWEASLELPGLEGTNKAWLEISGVPPLNISKHLESLISYPYGCIEQTTSSAFPQLYLDELTELSPRQKLEVQDNVKYALQRLMSFQLPDGGFSYWPGGYSANDWGTSYAGHFMLLAEQKGYSLPVGVKNKWLRYQRSRARNWSRQAGFRNGIFYKGHELQQAYCLYTLALAGSPDLGAMNRLREVIKSNTAKWRLAATYLLAGQANAANDLLSGQNAKVENYTEFSGTYGSGLRDKAMILETLTLKEDSKGAFMVLKEISDELNKRDWLSTQTAAWCFYAASRFISNMGEKSKMNIHTEINGKKEDFKTSVPFIRFPVNTENKTISVKVQNKGKGVVFTRLVARGTPLHDDGTALANNLDMEIWYTDKAGGRIDPVELYQGDDLFMNVKVKHPGIRGSYEEMALAAIIPSGWEIINQRLNDVPEGGQNNFEYQDIRDDRIYTYFDLPQNAARTFEFRLSASYEGKFYLPAVSCEAMYDNSVYARQPGKWVEVKKR